MYNLLYYVRIVTEEGLLVADRDFTNWRKLRSWAIENYQNHKILVTHPAARETDVYAIKDKLHYEFTHRGTHIPMGAVRMLLKKGIADRKAIGGYSS